MRRPLAAMARLCVAMLAVVASMPGHLQLVHRHAGGDSAHVHAHAEALAAHDRLHHERHTHAHHTHPHHPEPHAEAHVSPGSEGGPELWAATAFHVHGLNPFQRVARTMLSVPPGFATVARVPVAAPRTPLARSQRAAHSRGPPAVALS